MPQARKAATVEGFRSRRTSSAAAAAGSVLVGVGRLAFFRQVAIAVSREASTLGTAGVPVTVTEGTAVGDELEADEDVDVDVAPPSDEAFEQAVSAGTARAATAPTATSVRNGATGFSSAGVICRRSTHSCPVP
jgi:hypothetical protein